MFSFNSTAEVQVYAIGFDLEDIPGYLADEQRPICHVRDFFIYLP